MANEIKQIRELRKRLANLNIEIVRIEQGTHFHLILRKGDVEKRMICARSSSDPYSFNQQVRQARNLFRDAHATQETA